MGNSIRDRALNNVPPEEIVFIPEWDDKVLVKGMSLGEQHDFLESLPDPKSKNRNKKMQVQLVIRQTLDPETREPIFEQADADSILAADPRPYTRIAQAAVRLGGMEDEKTVEERLKENPTEDTS